MVSEEWMPYRGTKAFLDPAGRGKDEMAWAIIGQLHGYLYLKYVDGVKGGATEENLEKFVLSLREFDARELTIETNFGGEYLIPLIEPIIRNHAVRLDDETLDKDLRDRFPKGWGCAILGEHSSGQKEPRIIGRLENVASTHRLVVDPSVARDRELWKQWTRITKHRGCLEHDDRVEAVAGAVACFKDVLHQDAGRITQRLRQQKREALAKKFHNAKQKPAKWATV